MALLYKRKTFYRLLQLNRSLVTHLNIDHQYVYIFDTTNYLDNPLGLEYPFVPIFKKKRAFFLEDMTSD